MNAEISGWLLIGISVFMVLSAIIGEIKRARKGSATKKDQTLI